MKLKEKTVEGYESNPAFVPDEGELWMKSTTPFRRV
jgi:hypothetical protein